MARYLPITNAGLGHEHRVLYGKIFASCSELSTNSTKVLYYSVIHISSTWIHFTLSVSAATYRESFVEDWTTQTRIMVEEQHETNKRTLRSLKLIYMATCQDAIAKIKKAHKPNECPKCIKLQRAVDRCLFKPRKLIQKKAVDMFVSLRDLMFQARQSGQLAWEETMLYLENHKLTRYSEVINSNTDHHI